MSNPSKHSTLGSNKNSLDRILPGLGQNGEKQNALVESVEHIFLRLSGKNSQFGSSWSQYSTLGTNTVKHIFLRPSWSKHSQFGSKWSKESTLGSNTVEHNFFQSSLPKHSTLGSNRVERILLSRFGRNIAISSRVRQNKNIFGRVGLNIAILCRFDRNLTRTPQHGKRKHSKNIES